MNAPADCNTFEEVRVEIDTIDEQVVALFGKRAEYVKAAARFKASESAVAAPERFASMLETRRAWAEREGLSADLIERIYRDLVQYFIECEKEHWKSARRASE